MQQLKNILILSGIAAALTLISCESQPKVIEAESAGGATSAPIFKDGAAPAGTTMPQEAGAAEHHTVVALEALNTDKYTYIRAKENGEELWLATTRQEIQIGGNYSYSGGLLKKNFQSKEFNRVFETLYLVADFHSADAAAPTGGIPAPTEALEAPKNVKPAPGAIKIADLVANLAKYEGKTVKITGKVVKVNPGIMGRNWLHIQDGSGKNIDLTVTTNENIPLGAMVNLAGTLAVNKDFGAGYRYDYIVEGATAFQ